MGQCGSPHNNNHWPAASQRPGPQLHDESESLLLVISLSAQIIPLAFSDVVAADRMCVTACAKDFLHKLTAEKGYIFSNNISNNSIPTFVFLSKMSFDVYRLLKSISNTHP